MNTNNSMRQNYDFEKFSVEDFRNKVNDQEILLPKFQRDIVWTDKQRSDLVYSIRMGIPFGIFLLAGSEPYRLLDGLQRAHTILNLYEEPQKYFDRNKIEEKIIQDIRELLTSNGAIIQEPVDEEIKRAIENWIKSSPDTDTTTKFKGFILAKYLFTRFFIAEEKQPHLLEKGDLILSPIISSVHTEITNVGKITIPCILYSGPDENLPTIFEKLNSTGTPLSKYQIFAANWVDHHLLKMNDLIIKNIIYDEYIERQEEGRIFIEDLPTREDFLSQNINLYEYLLGLGRSLEKNFPSLFDKKGDSIGFTLSSACLQGNIRKIINIQNVIKNDFEVNRFHIALFDSINIVRDQLKPFIELRINKSNKSKETKQIIFHSDYQIVSFISKVFREKYDKETFTEVPSWKDKKAWVKNIPFHYLYDQIENNWRGSGDKRIEDMLASDRYLSSITKSMWENSLDNWFNETELSKKQSKRQRIDNDDLLFLNYIYTHLLTNFEIQSVDTIFHIEHLVPVKKLMDYISHTGDNNQGLPISAISNLCYLDSDLNNKKKAMTIYQYLNENPDNINIREVEYKFTFTRESDLTFVELLEGDNYDGWHEFYLDFLKDRFELLKIKFFDLNHID